MLTALRAQFDQQRAIILSNLDSAVINKSYSRKSWLNDLIIWGDQDELMRAAVSPTLYSLIVETGKDAIAGVGLDPSMYDPITTSILNYYQNRAIKIATDVNDETEKQLRAALSKGAAAGQSTYELRGIVEDIMGNASTMRADRIARTEVTRAQGFGDVEAWTQSGVVSGKEWFTAEDEHVCAFCDDLDGTVTGLDENFFDEGDEQAVDVKDKDGNPKTVTQKFSYDDIPHPPLHVNCRCTLLPVRG